jgi:hypothetical protein
LASETSRGGELIYQYAYICPYKLYPSGPRLFLVYLYARHTFMQIVYLKTLTFFYLFIHEK